MSVLTKKILTTIIPGKPGVQATPGIPAKPGYCTTEEYTKCEWVQNPDITFKYECWTDSLHTYLTKCDWVPYYKGKPFIGMFVPLYVYTCHTASETVCYPPTAAIPGTPGIAPTPTQVTINKQLGWNSSSRSIDKIDVGQSFSFTPAVGVMGAFVGLGPVAMDERPPSAFTHGVMVDLNGVRVYEAGVFVATLAGSYTGSAVISIVRNLDNTVTYHLTDGTTTSYTSAAPVPFGDLYAYAKLYSGGDRIIKTECIGGLAALTFYGQITLSGTSELVVGSPLVAGIALVTATFTGEGALFAGGLVTSLGGAIIHAHPMAMMFTGVGALLCYSYNANGAASLPPLISLGGDYAYGFCSGWLPSIKSNGSGGFYVPPTPTFAYGNLPIITSWALVRESQPGSGSASLPALISLAGDYKFGFANAWLPAFMSYGRDSERLEMQIISNMFMFGNVVPDHVLFMTITSYGQLISIYEHDIVVTQDTMSQLLLQDQFVWVGELNASFMSALLMKSTHMNQGVLGAMLNDLARVWVVNLDNGASSQYENYGFNSYANRNGESFGFADDGIYRLSGDDDQGIPINALVHLGKTHLNTPREKRIPAIYVAAASEGKLVLKIQAEKSDPYFYEMRSYSETLDKHRIDPGRGLRSGHWEFVLLNQDGADFELASLEFVPIVLSRNI